MFDFLKNMFAKKNTANMEQANSSEAQSAEAVYAEVEKQSTSNYSAAREAEAQAQVQAQETKEIHSSGDDKYAELRARANEKKRQAAMQRQREAIEEQDDVDAYLMVDYLLNNGRSRDDVKNTDQWQNKLDRTKRRLLEEQKKRHKAQANDVASFKSGAVWADRIAELIRNKEVEGVITPEVARDLIKYINTGQYERDKQEKEAREAAEREKVVEEELRKKRGQYRNEQVKATIKRQLKKRQKEQEKDSTTIVSGTVRADILADAIRAGEVEGPVTPDKAKAAIKKRIRDNGFDHS